MNNHFLRLSSAACALITSTVALPALAQPGLELETLLVTGERIPRSLKDTASSVVVTTGFELDAFAGPDTLDQIFKQTANVTASGEGNQAPTIRGANTSGVLTSLESFFGGSQPRATVQVDGRQLTFNEYVYSGESAWDIERVEIFRGPQTTTQGRNAISGAVYIQTAKPNHEEFEARVRGITGNDSQRQLSGVASGPIGDGQLAYRVSADYRELDSYIIPRGVTEDIGANLRSSETLNLRGRLSYRPENLDNFDALLTMTHTDTARPQTDSVDLPFENLERFNPGWSVFETTADAIVLELNYRFSDYLDITNVTTFSDVDVERFAPLGQGNADIASEDLTNETILRFQNQSGSISGLAGLYLSRFDSEESLNLSAFGLGIGNFGDQRDSAGVFSEITWSATSDLHITAGTRWQRDHQDRDGGFGGVIPVDFDESFDALLPKLEVAYDLSSTSRVGVLAEKGFNAGGFTFNFDTFETETFKDETLWNYELFYRGTFIDDRLSLNANLFYSDHTDLQIASPVEIGPEFFVNVFSNVGEARSIGFELDAKFQVTDAWFWQAGFGITNTEFLRNSDAGAAIDGNEFQRAPGITAVTGLVWQPNTQLMVSAFARYSDGYYSDDANQRINEVSSYFTADLQASYTFDRVRVFVDALNVTDEFYEVAIFDAGTLASIGTPRRVTVGIEYNY